MSDHYRAPGWFTRNVFNRLVAFLTRHGVSVLGSRVLAVRGRTSGEWRTTPVNLLTHDGRRFLVSPRGVTQWVRNLRAAGTGELRLGGRAESFRGRELTEEEKVPVLRAYLKRSKAPGRTRTTTSSSPSRPNTRRSRCFPSSSQYRRPGFSKGASRWAHLVWASLSGFTAVAAADCPRSANMRTSSVVTCR